MPPVIIRDYDSSDREQLLRLSQAFYAGQVGSFSLAGQIDGSRMKAKLVIGDAETGQLRVYALLAEQMAPLLKWRLELVVDDCCKEDPYGEPFVERRHVQSERKARLGRNRQRNSDGENRQLAPRDGLNG
ncbi:hypothetical protein [Paenibacillus sp. GYB003]|uniref:hypothetical protein n=1 Tax=Paenibacillus sp. GYB003 TaxID=2994392 RepID=UPI002F960E2B